MYAGLAILSAFTFLVIVVLSRYRKYMAALVAWIVGTVTGVNRDKNSDNPEDTPSDTPSETKVRKGSTKEKSVKTKGEATKSQLQTKGEATKSELHLSKPVDELIQATFQEEFSKLTKTPVQSKPVKRSKSDVHKKQKPLIPEETESDLSEGSSKLKRELRSSVPELSTESPFEHVAAKRTKKRKSKHQGEAKKEEIFIVSKEFQFENNKPFSEKSILEVNIKCVENKNSTLKKETKELIAKDRDNKSQVKQILETSDLLENFGKNCTLSSESKNNTESTPKSELASDGNLELKTISQLTPVESEKTKSYSPRFVTPLLSYSDSLKPHSDEVFSVEVEDNRNCQFSEAGTVSTHTVELEVTCHIDKSNSESNPPDTGYITENKAEEEEPLCEVLETTSDDNADLSAKVSLVTNSTTLGEQKSSTVTPIELGDTTFSGQTSSTVTSVEIEGTTFGEQTSPTVTPIESEVTNEQSNCIQTPTSTENDKIQISSERIPEEKPVNQVRNQEESETLPSSNSKMYIDEQIRVLTLNDNEHQDSTLYRIEKNWIIQFRLGPSLLGRKVYLYTNYPEHSNIEFKRTRYQLLKWQQDEGCKNADDTASYAEVVAKMSGSFHFYFTYDDAETTGPHGSGFFLVDPILRYGYNEELPLDSIQCQTVLAKMLGPFNTWESKLRVAKESGYNMIHFTPIQELGGSNSSYSLSEQLKLNPIFYDGPKLTFHDVEIFMAKMRAEWKLTSICDIVLNHTANESEWLRDHPECTYNCKNCPYMRPSYLLDAALHQFSIEVKNGMYEHKGIPVHVCEEDHLNAIRYALHTDVLPKINIPEMYLCDVNKLTTEFLNLSRSKVSPVPENRAELEELKLIQDVQYRRLCSYVDMTLALKLYNIYRSDCFDEETRLKRCGEEFRNKLEQLNKAAYDEIMLHLNAAVENCIAGMRYFRVQHDGPRIKEVTIKNPLVFRYFTDYGTPKSVHEHEELMYSENGKYCMAHNGWVMDADPLRNFAAEDSNVYIRREIIAWGDSVKLRYGDQPEDCPFLWNHMRQYVEQTAKIFDGVRLDNCHSTPIPVAEYLLDCARKVKPDLYVVAELFTNSDQKDNIFVNRLGISSLIREAMSAWDSHELGRLVYRYGGYPVGAFYQPNIRPLVPSVAHALFLDLTHDNPSPIEKRSVYDLLPSTALVNMACCASGSNRGYDELVPHHIHVVDETRQYAEWNESFDQASNPRCVTKKSGFITAKKAINELHYRLGMEGYNQVYVDQMDSDIVAVTRHCPRTHETVVLVAFTAFSHPSKESLNFQRDIKSLRVEGVLDEIILEASIKHKEELTGTYKFAKDSRWINGYLDYEVHMQEHIQLKDSNVFDEGQSGDKNYFQLNFRNFKPGSIVAIKVSLHRDVQDSIGQIRDLITTFNSNRELRQIISDLTLADMNRVLYRCDQEERDEGKGFGAYNIPNYGPLVYCGLQGFISQLTNIRPQNDLGHPMCCNLRDGNWMIDYMWQRLKVDDGTMKFGQWLEENTKHIKAIPRYLVPCYFDIVVTGVYIQLIERCYELMSEFVKYGSTFVKALALGSVQFAAVIKSSPLPRLSPNLAPPIPPVKRTEHGEVYQACVSLSAGLPHFTVGYTRNWGRDTFIALRGLMILTGRHQEARYHILAYAACLRHGLIPNLLDGGKNARFNCRDAVWWWLYCIQSYVEEVPNGIYILNDKVSRIYPTDDSPAKEPGTVDQPLYEIMQEALNVHFQGLTFRERNAGRQIDSQMTDKGFNNQIGIHPETGFVFGGNNANCGTWMDKMGSSEKAGNKGKPASPRDGSAIELVALCKSSVTWLNHLYNHGHYPYEGVERTHKSGAVTKWTFKQWAEKIQNNFEKHFWVEVEPTRGEIRPDLVNKRGIYKDCYGSSNEYTDFQLRCNFPIAMVVAPELFNPKHAWVALKMAEKYLLGPLGMKTLDPEDWAYCGDYDNSNDSHDHKVACGFNYHQGPEWVWPIGFYLRAKLYFSAENKELRRTLAYTKVILSKHFTELQTSPWRGLPELTNSNGSYCNDSSRTQAWSMSSVLEVLDDLKKIESNQPIY